MRFLIGWEDRGELSTIESFLNIGDRTVLACAEEASFTTAFENESFDAVLYSLDFPSRSGSYSLFQRLRHTHPDTPVVGAWFPGEVNHIAKFLLAGLHSFVFRDPAGEFIMLLSTTLESAHQGVLTRREALLSQRLREELESIRRLQQALIPSCLPAPPGYRLAGRYEPSQIQMLGQRPVILAGGDYYNAYSIGNDSLGLILGDAAGHGVNACLSMLTMHSLLTSIRGRTYEDTAEFVADVNRRMCRSSIFDGEQGFITMLYCHLNVQEHVLQWTSAGHPLPLLHDLTTNEVRPLGASHQSGIPLVISEHWPYSSWHVNLPARSRLVLYTDGLEEAFPQTNGPHQQFGTDGIIETLQRHVHDPLDEVMDHLFAASHAATEGAGRLDDTSVLLLERTSEA